MANHTVFPVSGHGMGGIIRGLQPRAVVMIKIITISNP
jgi:hypothetical protein